MYEYRYSFWVDEGIIGRYSDGWEWYGNTMFETRIQYIVKGNCGERILIDSEGYAVGGPLKRSSQGYLQLHIGMRLKDCWMPHRQIRTLVRQFRGFAKQIAATGRRGKIPVAVDVEVCTVQREGEPMGLAMERAMRPEFMPPLYLYEVSGIADPAVPMNLGRFSMISLEEMQAAAIRVEDVDKASRVMDVCAICGRKPMVGTQISTLPCSHPFHYHCIAPHLLEETNSNSCPICHHHPAAFGACWKCNCISTSRNNLEEQDDDDAILHQFWRQLKDDKGIPTCYS